VTICAYGVEAVGGRQTRLDAGLSAAVEDGLAPLVDRLANRLGADRVWRAVPVESHAPELAVGREAPLLHRAVERGGGGPRNAVEEASAASSSEAQPWDHETPRPVRLFRRPEPLEKVLALTPDDPPRQFQWRGRTHQVRRAEGPERIGEEWWKGAIEDVSVRHVRDYYRVEDEAGARFWLFRAGLYGDPDAAPKWWLHGLFG
jgi:protein ImuB